MNETQRYLITLKPMEDFFFGGEKTFGEKNNQQSKNKLQQKRSSYFAFSNLYPQQTALLGLLRHVLLIQNNALPIYDFKDKATALIGPRSFDAMSNEEQSFGAIQRIEPLMIVKDEGNKRTYYRMNLDAEEWNVQFDPSSSGVGPFGQILNQTARIDNFDPKKGYEPRLTISDLSKDDALSSIYKTCDQIGINKVQLTNDREDDSFFKQRTYRLENAYSFGFFASIANTYAFDGQKNEIVLRNDIVSFGGEQKQFYMHVEKATDHIEFLSRTFMKDQDTLEGEHLKAEKVQRVVLLSDAYIDENIYAHCLFAISETQDFRTVQHEFTAKSSKPVKSAIKMNLLKRGSILYVPSSKLDEVKNQLDKPKNFTQIGFNQYIISKN